MFYDAFCELCAEKGVSPTRAALEIGLSKATPTTWKKKGTTPQAMQLQKIANYFGVSVDSLLARASNREEDSVPDKKKPLVNNDEELTEYLEELRTRPEMKMLFQLTSKATKADVEKAVRIIEAMLREE